MQFKSYIPKVDIKEYIWDESPSKSNVDFDSNNANQDVYGPVYQPSGSTQNTSLDSVTPVEESSSALDQKNTLDGTGATTGEIVPSKGSQATSSNTQGDSLTNAGNVNLNGGGAAGSSSMGTGSNGTSQTGGGNKPASTGGTSVSGSFGGTSSTGGASTATSGGSVSNGGSTGTSEGTKGKTAVGGNTNSSVSSNIGPAVGVTTSFNANTLQNTSQPTLDAIENANVDIEKVVGGVIIKGETLEQIKVFSDKYIVVSSNLNENTKELKLTYKELENLIGIIEVNLSELDLLSEGKKDFTEMQNFILSLFEKKSTGEFDQLLSETKQQEIQFQEFYNNTKDKFDQEYGFYSTVTISGDLLELYLSGIIGDKYQFTSNEDGSITIQDGYSALESLFRLYGGPDKIDEYYNENELALNDYYEEYGEGPYDSISQEAINNLESTNKALEVLMKSKNILEPKLIAEQELSYIQMALYDLKQAGPLSVYESVKELSDYSKYSDVDYKFYFSEEQVKFMDKEEVSIYAYLYDTYGKGAASNYLVALQDSLNQREGAFIAQSQLNDLINSGDVGIILKSFGSGTVDGLINFKDGIANLFNPDGVRSVQEYKQMFLLQALTAKMPTLEDILGKNGGDINDARLEYNAAIQELENQFGKENVARLCEISSFVRTAAGYSYKFGTSLGNMLPSMVVSFIPVVGQPLGLTLMGLSSAGNAVESSYQRGVKGSKAYLYGALMGISEVSMEYLLGGIPGLSKSSGFTLRAMFGEGLEEAVQSFVEAGANYAFFGDKINLEELGPEALESFAMGFFMSMFLNGTGSVLGSGINTVKGSKTIDIKSFVDFTSDNKIEKVYFKELGKYLLAYDCISKGNYEKALKTISHLEEINPSLQLLTMMDPTAISKLPLEFQQEFNEQYNKLMADQFIFNGGDYLSAGMWEIKTGDMSKGLNTLFFGGEVDAACNLINSLDSTQFDNLDLPVQLKFIEAETKKFAVINAFTIAEEWTASGKYDHVVLLAEHAGDAECSAKVLSFLNPEMVDKLSPNTKVLYETLMDDNLKDLGEVVQMAQNFANRREYVAAANYLFDKHMINEACSLISTFDADILNSLPDSLKEQYFYNQFNILLQAGNIDGAKDIASAHINTYEQFDSYLTKLYLDGGLKYYMNEIADCFGINRSQFLLSAQHISELVPKLKGNFDINSIKVELAQKGINVDDMKIARAGLICKLMAANIDIGISDSYSDFSKSLFNKIMSLGYGSKTPIIMDFFIKSMQKGNSRFVLYKEVAKLSDNSLLSKGLIRALNLNVEQLLGLGTDLFFEGKVEAANFINREVLNIPEYENTESIIINKSRVNLYNQIFDQTNTSFGVNQGVFTSGVSEYKYVADYIKQKYNLSEATVVKALQQMDSIGVCSYASVVNMIFQHYIAPNGSFLAADFKTDFGFNMMIRGKDGTYKMNFPQMLADLFISTNLERCFDNNGKFIGVKNQEYAVLISGINMKVVLDYLASHNVTAKAKCHSIFSTESIKNVENPQAILNIIADKIQKGIPLNLSVYATPTKGYTLINATDGAIHSSGKANPRTGEWKGHAMTITGVTTDGRIIVDSWGKKYYYNLIQNIGSAFQISALTIWKNGQGR